MSKIFTRAFRVRFSETNANGWVGPSEYLKYLVETAYDWGETGGFGARDSQSLGITWVIRETEFTFFHPLRHNDVFRFTIWMVDWKRVRGFRAYELRLDHEGPLVARGIQQIVSLDSQTLRPTMPPESTMDHYRIENPRTFSDTLAGEVARRFPQVPRTSERGHTAQRRVEWRDIDSLGHVNNAAYAAFVEQSTVQAISAAGCPSGRLAQEKLALAPRRIYLKYHTPARLDETLESTTHLLDLHKYGGLLRVEIRRVPDRTLILESYLDWQLVDREMYLAKALPESMAKALEMELIYPA